MRPPSWLLLVCLLTLAGCARPAVPPAEARPQATPLGLPTPGVAVTVAEARAAGGAWLGLRVTVRGVVTSVEPGRATVQSAGAGLLLDGAAVSIAQEVIVSGRLAEVEGNLALAEVEEVIVEQAQVPFPSPTPFDPAAAQESLYVEVVGATVSEGGALQLADGQRLAVRALDAETERRLQPGTRLDAARGVLRRAGSGWTLLPPLPRDVVVAPPPLAPCAIQGAGRQSPVRGERVETVGVVVGVAEATEAAGFFIQVADCDGSPATSDGLFVAQGEGPPTLEAGQAVRLRGQVEEHYGRTQLQLEPDGLWVEAEDIPLPAAMPFAPPAEVEEAKTYFETLEGMLVTLPTARVVGPTSRFGEFAVVSGEVALVGGRVMRAGGPLGAVVLVAGDGEFGPYDVTVGDELGTLVGPLDFSFGAWKLQLTTEPTRRPAAPGPLPTPPALPPGGWSVASFNVENLFDSEDDPRRADETATLSPEALAAKIEKLAATVAGPLGLPTLVALQEVENVAVLEQLAAHPALGGRYEVALLEGNDARGIDVALLVEAARVEVVDMAAANPCSPLAAPGGGEAEGCPTDERRLFERPPLVARLRLDGARELYLVNNHFKSKRGGEEETRARRVAQARWVAALVAQLRAAAPAVEVLVVGDLNDDEASEAVAALQAGGALETLWDSLPEASRYSYIFQGVSQVLDHLLVTPGLRGALVHFGPVHLNADFPHALHADPTTPRRASDHDPLLAVFR